MSSSLVPLTQLAEINPPVSRSLWDAPATMVAFVPMAAVSEDGTLNKEEERPAGEVITGYTYFERGDVLLAKITPCMENGKAAYLADLKHQFGFGSTEFHVLRPRKGVDGRYLFYLVWNSLFRAGAARNMTGTAGQKRVPAAYLHSLRVPFPELREQRRIADTLDTVNRIRRKRHESLTLINDLVHSTFVQMFGDPVTNPKRWEVLPLTAITESIDYGVTAPATLTPIGPKFLRITDIQNNHVNWDRVPYCECDRQTAEAARLRSGDIVFARTGATTGKSFLITEHPHDAVFASYLIRVRASTRVSPFFLAEFFQSAAYWRQVQSLARGSAQPGINASKLAALQVPLPDSDLQQGFADFHIRAAALKMTLLSSGKSAQALFDNLLSRTFSGDPRHAGPHTSDALAAQETRG